VKPVVGLVSDDAENVFGVLTSGTSESVLLRIDPDSGAAAVIGQMGTAGIMAIANRGVATEIGMVAAVPAGFRLAPNYPNPFNPSTTIGYAVPTRSAVELTVHNTLGQLVRELASGEVEAGHHEVTFDAAGLSSGVYFYRLKAGNTILTRKMLLVR
jgi:hypothetical protein